LWFGRTAGRVRFRALSDTIEAGELLFPASCI
jgi:hypothetical protein